MTRDNPGGDAQSPVDAAVARFIEEPIGHKYDKFGTLNVSFADAKNWKRMRFFGYPMRAAFRYGKAPYALAVIDYSDAPDDDSPIGCVERFVERGAAVAELFDVQVGPLQRSLSQHYRGVEAVDWIERDRREAAAEAAERRRRKDLVAKRALARLQFAKLRPLRAAARRRRLQQARLRQQLLQQQPAAAAQRPAGRTNADVPDAARADGGGPLSWFRPVTAQSEAEQRRKALEKVRRRAAVARALARRHRHHKPEPRFYGKHDMPVIQTSGEVVTLLQNERYLGAVVAYRSWPGSCLVQGFAVRVGTDDELAEQALTRWLDEMAPRLEWRRSIHEAPAIEDR